MPEVRGGATGSKKRYAGLVAGPGGETLELVGLEAVRRDWSAVARRFQRELLELVFHDQPVERVHPRLRRRPARRPVRRRSSPTGRRSGSRSTSYTKTTPPHVKAARKQVGGPGRIVTYVVTHGGARGRRRDDRAARLRPLRHPAAPADRRRPAPLPGRSRLRHHRRDPPARGAPARALRRGRPLMSTPRRTLIRAGHVIAFDGRGHRLLRDGAVVLEGDRIVHVGPRGPRSQGQVDETVDARDRVLTPGLISTHAHIAGSPLDRSFIEDTGTAPVLLLGPLRDAAGPRRRPGRGGQPGLRRLLDGRAAPGRRDHRARDRPARRARGRARGRTSASASTSGSPSARGGGSRRTAGASTGSGTRSGAARGSRGRWPSTTASTAPTAAWSAAASPRPRSTRARPSSCARPSGPPTSAAARSRSTPPSP